MSLYRVLLADDEEDIRVGISRRMQWEELGFCLVGEAENGLEALELAEQLRPDVVLTDIKMPFMDGLELCALLTERLPAAKFVVFSGFDDFEYAKQAIRMNVSEYILKPINAPELSAVLQKLRRQLDAERLESRNLETLRRRYEESLPVLQTLFFANLFEGKILPGEIEERAARLEISLKGASHMALLTHFESGEANGELLALSVEQLLREHLLTELCRTHLFVYNNTVAAVLDFESGLAPVFRLIAVLNRVCKLAASFLDIKLTVGIGAPCAAAAQLSQSAQGARSALDYRVIVGAGRAIYIGDLEPNAAAGLCFDEEDERELTAAVKLGGREDVSRAVRRLSGKLREAGGDLSSSQLFFLEQLTCLLRLIRAESLDPQAVFGEGFNGAIQLTDFSSPEQLEQWCLASCLRLWELIGRRRKDTTGRTVERAKSFIEAHYDQSSLSVETLCEHLYLSPAYFSTLFKRETGMSFTACVTVVRMEKAAQLLRETEDKTYRIAEKTGYTDPNYFSYVFKKHFGISPSKYRAGE